MGEKGLFDQINQPADMEKLSDLEKKHVPVIDAPDSVKTGESFEVTVHVGKLLRHPNEVGHSIQWIALLQNDLLVTMVELTPGTSEPKVTLNLVLEKSAELRALARCNLHGEWEYRKKITAT